MGRRSLRASSQGIQDIKKALKRKKWSQTYIAGAVGCSRQTIWSLLQGNPTDCDVFMEVCKQLGLNCEEIAEPELSEQEEGTDTEIDALVQEVRQQIQSYIQEKCGTMRVLDMSQPIGLGEIYTNVNILEKLTRTRGLELAELMRNADPEKFDRFCLGDVRERRVPGLEAVDTFSKLMILGKPGAGKTTFLKHLAIQCIGEKFQGDRVPVFITLKDFAEADGKPDLLGYITRLMPHNVEISPTPLNKGGYQEGPVPPFLRGARGDLQQILSAGRALVLLDGLDEVRDADSSRLLRQIQEFSQQFPQNQFVITCRIAAKEYTFEKFTEVEIADFDDEQIADFSGKWFRSKNDPIKAERFLQKLKEDEAIRELATNPLLLTLLCLVFEDSGSFPTNRAELYENGVDVLLKKWDVKRNIERDQVYKRLSLKRKEDLLSQIARTTFEAGNYFFKQREVKRYINQYIQNLPEASTDSEALELDSAAVLKSIEAQHGLLVKRARGIYSFSHLTFHEYFTARKIKESCNPYVTDDPTLQGLVSHLIEKRWQEVFLLTVGMLDSADALLRLMKAQIDELLAGDEKLQQFLRWLDEKSRSVEVAYKLTAVRAFYLALIHKVVECKFSYDSLPVFPIPELASLLEPGFTFDYELRIDVGLLNTVITASEPRRIWNEEIKNWVPNFNYNGDFYDEFESVLQCPIQEKLRNELLYLKYELPQWMRGEIQYSFKDNSEQFQRESWFFWLKVVMTEQRNIGHDWQFSDAQIKRLQQYYDANKLLVDCLNSDCYVSREVRQEIEETLLLPIAEIERRRGL